MLLYALGVLVVLLVLAQLLLPRIAASRIRSRLARYGEVESVRVSAWPAIELLWGHAGSVRVRAGRLAFSPARAESLLWEARGLSSLQLSVAEAQVGPLHVQQVSFSKHGVRLQAQALASQGDLDAALPAGAGVQVLRSEAGELEMRVSGSLFGVGASLNAIARASEGRLVVQPAAPLLGALQLTLFSDPHVYIEGIGASAAERDPLLYRLQLSAQLR